MCQRRCGGSKNNKIICCKSTVWGYDNMADDLSDNNQNYYQNERGRDRWENDYEGNCEKERFNKRDCAYTHEKQENRCCICKIFDCLFGGW